MAAFFAVVCSIWFAGAGVGFIDGAVVTLRVKWKADPVVGAGTVNAEVEVEQGPRIEDSGSDDVGKLEPAGEKELGVVEGNGSADGVALVGKSASGS